MPFCTNCGKPFKEQYKFCQSCGMPLEPVIEGDAPVSRIITSPPTIRTNKGKSSALPGVEGETIKCVVYNIQLPTPQRGRLDYNLIITNFRSIFAQKTVKVGQDAMKMSKDSEVAQGKGFFGKWKSQVAGPNMYVEWYKSIAPEQALNETPGNWAISNDTITSIRTKWYGAGDEDTSEFHTEIQTTGENYKYIAKYDTSVLLKQVFSKTLFK